MQAMLEDRQVGESDDTLHLIEEARQRYLDEIEFHEQEKERHDARITELMRACGRLVGSEERRKPSERRKTRRIRVFQGVVKGRFNADQGQTPSVGRLIVEHLRTKGRSTTSEIETMLAEKGRPCKPGVALSRLLEEGKIVKVERGIYDIPRNG